MEQVSEWNIPLTEKDVSRAAADMGTPITAGAARFAIKGHRIAYVQIGRTRFTSRSSLLDFFDSCRVEPKSQTAQAV